MKGTVILSSEEVRLLIREELQNALPQIDEVVDPGKRFYLEEAADYLRLPIETFRRHINKIGGAKIGKRWTFTRQELDRYVERNRNKIASERICRT